MLKVPAMCQCEASAEREGGARPSCSPGTTLLSREPLLSLPSNAGSSAALLNSLPVCECCTEMSDAECDSACSCSKLSWAADAERVT